MATKQKRVRRYRLEQLVGQDDNPKAHEIETIKRSLYQYGYVEMVAIDTRTNRMVAGHGRVEALRQMRDAERCWDCGEPRVGGSMSCDSAECGSSLIPENVRVVRGDWEIEVICHEFDTEADARAYVVASNRTSMLGGWADGYDSYVAAFRDDDALLRTMGYQGSADAEFVSALETMREVDQRVTTVIQHERALAGHGAGSGASEVRVVKMASSPDLKPPFPYFGGKRRAVDYVWSRIGEVKQYLEPFCGATAMLLGAPRPAPQETIGDQNLYIANFWRVVRYQPDAVAEQADYPVVHIDLTARHRWLTNPNRVAFLTEQLQDPEWVGDAQIAGWWVWGQCAWIGSGWCSRDGYSTQEPSSSSHRGIHAVRSSQVPESRVPHSSDRGMGIQSPVAGVRNWMRRLSERLRHVVVINGDWSRSLNSHYGRGTGGVTGVFLDPPYKSFERLYRDTEPVAVAVEQWCRENGSVEGLRIALCGHVGDYDLPGWEIVQWSRGSNTYGSDKTKDDEAIYFSPHCLPHAESDDNLAGELRAPEEEDHEPPSQTEPGTDA